MFYFASSEMERQNLSHMNFLQSILKNVLYYSSFKKNGEVLQCIHWCCFQFYLESIHDWRPRKTDPVPSQSLDRIGHVFIDVSLFTRLGQLLVGEDILTYSLGFRIRSCPYPRQLVIQGYIAEFLLLFTRCSAGEMGS